MDQVEWAKGEAQGAPSGGRSGQVEAGGAAGPGREGEAWEAPAGRTERCPLAASASRSPTLRACSTPATKILLAIIAAPLGFHSALPFPSLPYFLLRTFHLMYG